ncbi:MAG TPA: protein phosphatase 2C domain-containing protein, partial [Polyangiaceae bacterium]|nr:protein phosphatase 2C domain-containing protein [Polyangiaceae bacterium]
MPQILPRFDFKVAFAAAQDIGRVRQISEDVQRCVPETGVFIVADGMGGQAGGKEAAGIAVDAVEKSFRSERTQAMLEAYATDPSLDRRRDVLGRLRRAVDHAHEAVQAAAAAKPELAGMGTTLDIVALLRDKAFIAHVGDGRVYLARAQATLQLTQDHTDFALKKAHGKIRAAARANASARLSSAVGAAQAPKPDLLCIEVGRGDRVLVCSDGVHGQLSGEAQLSEILRVGDATQAANALVDAVRKPGRDNATSVVLDIGDPFVKRPAKDRGLSMSDLAAVQRSALLNGLSDAAVLYMLSAAVELEVEIGSTVAQAVANDLAAYVVIEGLLELPNGRSVSDGALLFPESLIGASVDRLPVVKQAARLLRIRRDDFGELCEADPSLGLQLYRRLAEHL